MDSFILRQLRAKQRLRTGKHGNCEAHLKQSLGCVKTGRSRADDSDPNCFDTSFAHIINHWKQVDKIALGQQRTEQHERGERNYQSMDNVFAAKLVSKQANAEKSKSFRRLIQVNFGFSLIPSVDLTRE